MNQPVHIVAHFAGIGGTEAGARTLADLVGKQRPTILWADSPTAAAPRYGATPIQAFSGRMPRGGTLILDGPHVQLGMWLDYVKPHRLILICNLVNFQLFWSILAKLERPSLPKVEIVFVSERLKATFGLPGVVAPALIDLGRFHPAAKPPAGPATVIGRHSRDVPEKHHPEDISLYRMLAWQGHAIRLMGATCLGAALATEPRMEVLPAGAIPAAEFLRSLDVFFYRTHPTSSEASGRVVIEALACGLPVVAHQNGGYTDWIEHGVNGYIFASQEEAFDYIERLANSADARQTFARAARAAAEKIAGCAALQTFVDWLCR